MMDITWDTMEMRAIRTIESEIQGLRSRVGKLENIVEYLTKDMEDIPPPLMEAGRQ